MARSGRPDAAQREAARKLEVTKRLREVEEAVLLRAPEHDLEPSLERISGLMDLLGQPQHAVPVIHVTGTNGKTSTSRIIGALLRELGLNPGRFTSPHLHDLRERITIGGEPILPEAFLEAYDHVLPFVEMVDLESAAVDAPPMTYFEVLTAVAYAAFADAPVDVAVVEVGMGGSWDATNVADGVVSVVTPVSVDHVHFLGSSLTAIATEKSGVIKADALTVSAVQDPDVTEILQERAAEVGARLALEGVDIGILARDVAVGGQLVSLRGLAGDYEDVLLSLHGAHQAQNALLAVAAVEAFLGGGQQRLPDEVVRDALAHVSSPGRLEIVRRSPTVIVDSAHNPAGAAALRQALNEEFTFARLVGVLAVLRDKDAEGILVELEPVLDHVVVSRTTSPRAMRPEALGDLAREVFGDHRVTVVRDLPDALDHASGLADEGGVSGGIVATGSVTTAADVRMLLGTTDT